MNTVLTGEFVIYMSVFTALVYLESITTLRVTSIELEKGSDNQLETFFLGVTNIILGLLGLLPVSIPVARNILAKEAGGNNKIYLLEASVALLLLSTLLWPLGQLFPTLIVCSINTCLGLLMIDLSILGSAFQYSPFLMLPVGILLIGSLFFDIILMFAISLLVFYIRYFYL